MSEMARTAVWIKAMRKPRLGPQSVGRLVSYKSFLRHAKFLALAVLLLFGLASAQSQDVRLVVGKSIVVKGLSGETVRVSLEVFNAESFPVTLSVNTSAAPSLRALNSTVVVYPNKGESLHFDAKVLAAKNGSVKQVVEIKAAGAGREEFYRVPVEMESSGFYANVPSEVVVVVAGVALLYVFFKLSR